ncbi:hypothetical protein BHE74_00054291, partial [Ensete ventricosum]
GQHRLDLSPRAGRRSVSSRGRKIGRGRPAGGDGTQATRERRRQASKDGAG